MNIIKFFTEKYKIDHQDTGNRINTETAKFANKLNIKDKLRN